MMPSAIDAYRVLPELVWCGFGVLVMLLQPFVRSRQFFTFVALIGTLAGGARCAEVQRIGDEVFSTGLVCDGVFSLRDCAGVRVERHHDADQDGLAGSVSQHAV